MCLGIGPSGGDKAINNETGAAYGTAINQAKAEFGDASTVFNDLMQTMAPIEKAGPGQTGYTAQEMSAINAQTVDQTAAQYKNAAVAVKSGISAQGGGNIALPSGVNIATEEALAEAGAQQESAGLRANTIANYDQGNKNWQFATSAVEKAPGVFDTANQATNAETGIGRLSLDSQKVIDSAPSWQKIAMGALGSVAGMVPVVGPALSAGLKTATGAAPGSTDSSGQSV